MFKFLKWFWNRQDLWILFWFIITLFISLGLLHEIKYTEIAIFISTCIMGSKLFPLLIISIIKDDGKDDWGI